MAVESERDELHRLPATVQLPIDAKYKDRNGQQKKIPVQDREVTMLQNVLANEQEMNGILKLALRQVPGAPITIPSFVPPKVKELLVELSSVNDEIAKLERQISELQADLTHEQDVTRELKLRKWQQHRAAKSNPVSVSELTSVDDFSNGSVTPQRVSFDTKTLHFISKAIKGDFTVNSDFSSLSSQVTDDLNDENGFRENTSSRKSWHWQKQPVSPSKGSPRLQLTPKRDKEQRVSFDLTPESSASSADAKDKYGQKTLSPNKLSESIMKYLIFIYVRLLRTARQIELEKSGGAAALRSVHTSSISSRSFRTDPTNLKAIQMLQKDSRQQDPYGVFVVEESIPRDVGPYKNLIIFGSNSLDLKYLSSSSFVPLLKNLRSLMNSLRKVDLGTLSQHQKLAFWINMYNACVMHGFLQYGVPTTPEKLLNLMNEATLNIGGNVLNPQAIENFILRKPTASPSLSKDSKADAARQLYGLNSYDPNVTFALCCGTRSSPSVRIYTAEGVTTELEKSKLEYLQASIMVTSTGKIAIPELLLKNMIDFAQDKESLVKWVCHQLPVSGLLRKSMVDCFRGHKLSAIIEKIAYDFEFQYLLANISSPY